MLGSSRAIYQRRLAIPGKVAPIAESFVEKLASTTVNSKRIRTPGTRLTQCRKYEGQGGRVPKPEEAPKQQSLCKICGAAVSLRNRFCHSCFKQDNAERLAEY